MSTVATDKYEPPANGFRTFVAIWITQAFSAFGSQLTFFALTIWLATSLYPSDEQKPQLAFALTAVSLSFTLSVLIAPVAGAWADRHDRKQTMIVVDFINGVLSLVLMGLILAGMLELWILLILFPILAVLFQFHNAAFDASYAMIVPEKQLPRANGMMQTMWSLSAILSPAIAATIIALPGMARQGSLPDFIAPVLAGIRDGAALAIGIDAVTFFIGAAVLPFLYVPSPKRTDLGEKGTKPKKSMWADIKEGARYIKLRKPLLWLLATFTVVNFASSPLEVFIPLLLKFNLAPDWQAQGFTFESSLALLSTLGGVGGLAGGILMSTWGGLKRRRVYGVVVPILIAGVVQTMYGLSPWLYATGFFNFMLVALIPIMNAHSQTIWQTQVPRELQGRVFSVRRVIAQFSAPLGVMLAGFTGAIFNPGYVLAALGIFIVVFATFQLFNPYLLRVEDKEFLDKGAAEAGDRGGAAGAGGAGLDSATAQPTDGDVSLGSPTSVPAMPTPSDEIDSAGEDGQDGERYGGFRKREAEPEVRK
ncbi:MAG: MFS transporter [Chloroflexota bacterium]|nr:MFS transporter [Chloroflexota bacterium]MDQ5865101.1 MFS transporter [Chloroflexota bacterium]